MADGGAAVKLCLAMSSRERPPTKKMSPEPSIEELKAMLEAQLDHQLGPTFWGCWPFLVALLGIALGAGLLLLQ